MLGLFSSFSWALLLMRFFSQLDNLAGRELHVCSLFRLRICMFTPWSLDGFYTERLMMMVNVSTFVLMIVIYFLYFFFFLISSARPFCI